MQNPEKYAETDKSAHITCLVIVCTLCGNSIIPKTGFGKMWLRELLSNEIHLQKDKPFVGNVRTKYVLTILAYVQVDKYIYKICIVNRKRGKLCMFRQAAYMQQQYGHAQFEFTDDRFSCDAINNATQQ